MAADAWARAGALAYAVRWRGVPAAEALTKCGVRCSAALRDALKRYAPHLFSISLFEIAGSKSFDHYAAATVTFVRDKLDNFGGCDVVLHLNTLAAGRTPLLRQLHAAARGRIEFVEVAFTPRKGVAPWLLAASRLVPLLEQRGRTVVSMDVHDDLVLQNTQLVGLLGRLRKEKKELALTFWLAEDGCDDCLIQSPLPVPKLKSYAPEYGGGGGAFGLHAHTDGGMMVAKGEALREDLLAAHGGLGFGEFVGEHVRGAQTIPHGIEEMALDAYLQQAGWMRIGPRVLFAVHRSLLAGRGRRRALGGGRRHVQRRPRAAVRAARGRRGEGGEWSLAGDVPPLARPRLCGGFARREGARRARRHELARVRRARRR